MADPHRALHDRVQVDEDAVGEQLVDGGLADTVEDGVTGFTFGEASARGFSGAIRRALDTFGQKKRLNAMRRTAMSRREHRLDLAELDKARAAHAEAHKAADAALRAEIDRLVGTIEDRCAQRRGPRITRL